jgi:hypothetical protein
MSQIENKGNSVRVNILVGDQDQYPFHNMYEMESYLRKKDERKIYLGDKDNMKCRFCHKDNTQTQFKKTAHIIPEFMGNKNYFSYYECDSCNEHFSKYETALANYGGIMNTFSKIKGKKGFSKHKGINEQTETLVENNKVLIRINEPSEDNEKKSVIYDKDQGTLTFNTNKYSYVPIDAFKALIKIGFCMLKNDSLCDYELTRGWLLEENELKLQSNNPIFSVFQKIGGKLFPHPIAYLMRKKIEFIDMPFPTHSMLIFYGLFAYQVFIPGNLKDDWIWENDNIILPIENHITHSNLDSNNKIKSDVDMVDFSSNELFKNPKQVFSVNFKEIK